MMEKRLFAFTLALALICSFAGCKNKEEVENKTSEETVEIKTEEVKNEDAENKTSAEIVESKTEDGIVGTWVVTKTEVYDGPLKQLAEQITNTYFYVGSEHEFTADGVYKNADGTYSTKYSILDENHISMTDMGSGDATMYDYELNGDEYVQYGIYTGTAAHLGHANAVYFKRK